MLYLYEGHGAIGTLLIEHHKYVIHRSKDGQVTTSKI
jgi:hypothetical protein